MKTRERINKLRCAESWTDRYDLARDGLPGTPFDPFLRMVFEAVKFEKRAGNTIDTKTLLNARQLQALGGYFLRAMIDGNGAMFKGWADAVETWHDQRGNPDRLRLALLHVCPDERRAYSMREIVAALERRRVAVDFEGKVSDETRRRIRTLAAELGICIQGTPGRPRKNPDAKHSQRPR